KVGHTLIATILEELGDRDALQLNQDVCETIERTGARGLLLDLSAVVTVDSFLGRLLGDIALGARLLGAQAVVVGMQPAVAITVVELGLDLRGLRTALTPEKGLQLLDGAMGRDGRRAT